MSYQSTSMINCGEDNIPMRTEYGKRWPIEGNGNLLVTFDLAVMQGASVAS